MQLKGQFSSRSVIYSYCELIAIQFATTLYEMVIFIAEVVFMKKLYQIPISILLAAPLSSFLSASIDSLISLNEDLQKTNILLF